MLNSNHIWTWLNMSIKSVPLVVVTPLIEAYNSTDIFLWSQLLTFYSIVLSLDLGIVQNCTRLISYSRSEKSKLSKFQSVSNIYTKLSILIFAIGLIYIVSSVEDKIQFLVILVSASITLNNNKYIAYLNGSRSFHISQRSQFFAIFIALILSFSLFILTKNTSYLLVFFLWPLLFRLLMQHKALKVHKIKVKDGKNFSLKLLSDSWKTAIGVLFGSTFMQIFFLYLSESNFFSTAIRAASVLIVLQILRQIAAFTQVPIMVELPRLARMYIASPKDFLRFARKVVIKSLGLYIAGVIIFASIKKISVVDVSLFPMISIDCLFFFMAAGLAFERLYNFLLHLLSATDKILWHVLNPLYAAIFILIFYTCQGHDIAFLMGFGIATLTLYPYVILQIKKRLVLH